MDLDYLPGGRWVRLLAHSGWSIVPVGRWHLASRATTVGPGTMTVALMCGRELRAEGQVSEIASIVGLPKANACPSCERAWVREGRLLPRRAAVTTSALA